MATTDLGLNGDGDLVGAPVPDMSLVDAVALDMAALDAIATEMGFVEPSAPEADAAARTANRAEPANDGAPGDAAAARDAACTDGEAPADRNDPVDAAESVPALRVSSERERLARAARFLKAGRLDEARAALLPFLGSDPVPASAQRLLVRVAATGKDADLLARILPHLTASDDARAACSALLAADRVAEVGLYLNAGGLALLAADERRLPLYKRFVRQAHDVLKASDDPDLLAEMCCAVHAVAPDDALVARLLPRLVRGGLIRARELRGEARLAVLERTLALDPANTQTIRSLAEAYLDDGNAGNAFAMLVGMDDATLCEPRIASLALRAAGAKVGMSLV